ncbi:MAG: heme lyase CcmF/NrfE family subunit, partial [Legionellales bacterium]|nr:heme lyase CcmF/NrfE family subunit [Legionellales bacterium]
MMLAEFGSFALIIALGFALLQAMMPWLNRGQSDPLGLAQCAKSCVFGQTAFLGLAYLILTIAFVTNDFSVAYVAHHSSLELPWWYKATAVWGGHEGSMLLWVVILAVWSSAVAWRARDLPPTLCTQVLAVLGWLSVGFILFLLFTSHPFARLLPQVPVNGRDLNPLLQDAGFLVHPPVLYMGYVGFAVAYAFAMAALIQGKLEPMWAKWARPWTLFAWCWLTLGIALGSWWAYRELGWGGWWFWDPVENASLMPWLAGTALIHSLVVTQKRNTFKAWTVLLAISAFSLSLLGTFLVRSGVLTSVHAFAVDPQRGLFMLIFLGVVISVSLVLFALRAPVVRQTVSFHLVSKETFLLLNNTLLLVVLATVLLGTLYPLIIDGLGLGKLSVGAPYFNAVVVPLAAPLLFVMGLGPQCHWREMSPQHLLKQLRGLLLISLSVGILLPWVLSDRQSLLLALGLFLGVWIVAVSVYQGWGALRTLKHRRLPLSWWAMMCAHLGVGILVLGITLTTSYSIERTVRLAPGEQTTVGAYRFVFHAVAPIAGSNYQGLRAEFKVWNDQREIARLFPSKKYYAIAQMTMTDTGIQAGFWRDLYVALGEPLEGDAWAVRIHYKPFVRWIWLGALLIAFGGLLAAVRPIRRRQAGYLIRQVMGHAVVLSGLER